MFWNKYPYTDLHQLNLDYILKTVKLMDEKVDNFINFNEIKYADPIEWNITTQYQGNTVVFDNVNHVAYISLKPVPAGVLLTNTDYWTVILDLRSFYDEIGNLNDLQTLDKSTIVAAINEVFETVEKVKNKNTPNKGVLHGNLILNDFHVSTNGAGQGAAYIGNGKIVIYLSTWGNNTGLLRCYDINTYSVIWEHSIQAYHGNTMAYNPNNNHLYICGAIDNTDSSSINKIVEIDLVNPSIVYAEYSLPGMVNAFAMAFDKSKNQFYAKMDSDSRIYIFNAELDTLIDTILLSTEDGNILLNGDNQGFTYADNGLIYSVNSATKTRSVIIIDTAAEKIVNVIPIENVINECRSIGELENIIYDFDKDAFYITSLYLTSGVKGYTCEQVFEVDLYKSIEINSPVPLNDEFGLHSHTGAFLMCVNGCASLKPTWLLEKEMIPAPNDGLMYDKMHGDSIIVYMLSDYAGYSRVTNDIEKLQIYGSSARIRGNSSSDKVHIDGFDFQGYSSVMFLDCSFGVFNDGYENRNLGVGYNSKIYCQRCEFEDLGISGVRHHVTAYTGSDVRLYQPIFVGTATSDTDAAETGSITVLP